MACRSFPSVGGLPLQLKLLHLLQKGLDLLQHLITLPTGPLQLCPGQVALLPQGVSLPAGGVALLAEPFGLLPCEVQLLLQLADFVRVARLLRPDLLVIGATLLDADVLGLLGELLLQGVPILDKAGIRVGVELALPLVKSLLAGDQDFLELLQSSPLRLLLRSSACKLALSQRELPLRVRSGLEACQIGRASCRERV